ncbi:MAG: AAA family ATPase, partial [Coleofasciculus sp. S288]|nr:AAA family ATPase [Coleofasciculus sp. S288]
GILYPELVVKQTPASPSSVPDSIELRQNSFVIKTLDHRQECIAKAIGTGHRIIYGVAGSGKTLILLCRAKLLINQNSNQRILILCFNVCLARYLKSMLHDDTQNPQFTRIDVFNFHKWASSLAKKIPARLPGLPVDYCEELIGEILLEKLSSLPSNQKWDAVLVDEAQTFFPSWFKCCVAALKDSENGNLMVVADGNQNLYQRRGFTWKSVGIKAVGRTTNKKHQLDKNYRNTQEILEAAWSVINQIQNLEETGNSDTTDDSEVKFTLVAPRLAVRHGSLPVLHIQQTKNQDVEAVIRQIQNLYQIGYAPNEIAVLYRMAGEAERRMLNYLAKQLEQLGIGSYWVTESRSSERSYNVNSSGVRIISTLNSLGLEFKVVLILWVQDWQYNTPAQSQTDAMNCRRLYVAMTRAQDELHVFGSGNSRLLESLKQSQTFEIQQG